MIFKYELRFVAFTWPNLNLLVGEVVGRNFVSGICKQAVGGRPTRYAPDQACNGIAQRQPWPLS